MMYTFRQLSWNNGIYVNSLGDSKQETWINMIAVCSGPFTEYHQEISIANETGIYPAGIVWTEVRHVNSRNRTLQSKQDLRNMELVV